MAPYNSTLVVCMTLLQLKVNESEEVIAEMLNVNRGKLDLRQGAIVPHQVGTIWQEIHNRDSEWVLFATQYHKDNEGIQWAVELIKDGALYEVKIPRQPCTIEGYQRTLESFIDAGWEYAMVNGLTSGPRRVRSFVRTREGDAFGYGDDEQYPSYDHPGNLGY